MASGATTGTATSAPSTSTSDSCARSWATRSPWPPCGAWGTGSDDSASDDPVTRRLTLTMVAVVAGALVVAGFGSLALIRAQARRDTVHDLRTQAQGVAALVDDAGLTRNGSPALRRIL